MHGVANIPSIDILDDCLSVQNWYLDDNNAVGSPDNLNKIFDSLKNINLNSATVSQNATLLPKSNFLKNGIFKILAHKKWNCLAVVEYLVVK